jgi:hypothetical protein
MAPDGLKVALTTPGGLQIRDLDRLETRTLPGTEGAVSPFWSEDSTALLYGAKGRLWRAPIAGSAPVLVGMLPGTGWDQDAGGAWTADGSIIYTNGSSALMRVPAVGGDSVPVLEPSGDDLHFHNVSGLPDHRGVLFITHRKQGPDTLELLADGQRRLLLRLEGSGARTPDLLAERPHPVHALPVERRPLGGAILALAARDHGRALPGALPAP